MTTATTTDTLVEVDENRSVSLAGLGFPEHTRYHATTEMDGTIFLRPAPPDVAPPGDLSVTEEQFLRNLYVMLDRVAAGGFIYITRTNGKRVVLIPAGRYEALKALAAKHVIEL